ncbi:fungal pheromone mating factor STE2 GPCR-domain-containing protein [Paraphoma chrysanthemicola]|nr:fungal pheromone mating factor STE2 GPCR-domain-containing protein [Paraphoma chrysanthemicola]
MSMEASTLPDDFDPWKQTIVLRTPDGGSANVTVEDFDVLRIYTGRLGINYGSQVGASLAILLVLLLLTRSEKRKSTIFIINAACLLTNAIRCILFCCYVTSAMMHPYTLMSGDYSHVKQNDLSVSVATNIFTLIVSILVMFSLSLQVWVVCVTSMPIHRFIIMGVTTIVACVATGFKMAYVILTIRETLNWASMQPYIYLVSTSYIMQAVAIWLYSCVFTYKLGHAILQRRKLNMPQFGPMQIVFIMGCQTMVIPAIFSCFQFRRDTPELGAQALTVVCIFLPLSAIWAGVINDKVVAMREPNSHHQLIRSEIYRSPPASTLGSNASNTATEKSRQLSVCTCSSKGKGIDSTATTPSHKRNTSEYEDDNIYVGREFNVSHADVGDHV